MRQTSKEVILEFNLPNFKREEIKVKLYKNSIYIKAQKKNQKKLQRKDFLHLEKESQNFNYKTTVPEINPNNTKISFKKGVLKIVAQRA